MKDGHCGHGAVRLFCRILFSACGFIFPSISIYKDKLKSHLHWRMEEQIIKTQTGKRGCQFLDMVRLGRRVRVLAILLRLFLVDSCGSILSWQFTTLPEDRVVGKGLGAVVC
ncbi:hypothetical protein EV426DRAFT_325792 [Tirmania nivea]|nr:hypothetical protein EV426DRAFT_325792 [Tirmania nivea]